MQVEGCSFDTKWSHRLQRHLANVHYPERRHFACTVADCVETFFLNCELTDHIRRHTTRVTPAAGYQECDVDFGSGKNAKVTRHRHPETPFHLRTVELLKAVTDGTIEDKLTAVGKWDCGPCGLHYQAGKSLEKHEGSEWHHKRIQWLDDRSIAFSLYRLPLPIAHLYHLTTPDPLSTRDRATVATFRPCASYPRFSSIDLNSLHRASCWRTST